MITSQVMAWLRLLEIVQESKMDLSIRAYENQGKDEELYEVEIYTLDHVTYEVTGSELPPLATELLAVMNKKVS